MIERDEHGQWLCPFKTTLQDWGPDEEDRQVPELLIDTCGQPLYFSRELTAYVTDGMDPADSEFESWEVRCGGGHVLATSQDENGNGTPEWPFSIDLLERLMGKPE